ncbi:MAG: hypothetical protein KDB53_07400 [Planctomycetes bacterium]|nr:hypothetical protein [Planctomycetota bacterium]
MGSPAYMAPEMAWGDGSSISAKTDVYLLGAILHELLTGQPPHAANSLWTSVLSAAKPNPPVYDTGVPTELASTARRALSIEPSERQADVREFAADIRKFRDHRQSLELSHAASLILDRQVRDPDRQYRALARAIEGFRQSLVLWPENPDAVSGLRRAQLVQVKAALALGDLELAAEELEASTPQDEEGQRLIEELQVARRRARRARAKARLLVWSIGVIILSLTSAYLLARESDRLQTQAQLSKVQESSARMVAANSAFSSAQRAARSGSWKEALEDYERAQEYGYADPILITIGMIESAAGMSDLERVAELLSDVAEICEGPHRAKLDLLRGEILVDRSRTPQKGLDLIRAAVASGDLDTADQAFGEAVLAPTLQTSFDLLEKALGFDPSHRMANALLLGLLAGTGQAQRLQELAERLQVRYPNDPQSILAKSLAIAVQGKVEEAISVIDSLESRVNASELAHARWLAHNLSFSTVIMGSLHASLLMGRDQEQILKGAFRLVKEMGAYLEEVQKHEDAMAAEGHALLRITPAHKQYVRSVQRAIGLDKVIDKGRAPRMQEIMGILSDIKAPKLIDLDAALRVHPEDGSLLMIRALSPDTDHRRAFEMALESLKHEGLWDHRRMARFAVMLNAADWMSLGGATPEDRPFIQESVEPILQDLLAEDDLSERELQAAIYVTTLFKQTERTMAIAWAWQRLHPDSVEPLYWRADAHSQRGELEPARELVEAVLAKNPEHAYALNLRSRLDDDPK